MWGDGWPGSRPRRSGWQGSAMFPASGSLRVERCGAIVHRRTGSSRPRQLTCTCSSQRSRVPGRDLRDPRCAALPGSVQGVRHDSRDRRVLLGPRRRPPRRQRDSARKSKTLKERLFGAEPILWSRKWNTASLARPISELPLLSLSSKSGNDRRPAVVRDRDRVRTRVSPRKAHLLGTRRIQARGGDRSPHCGGKNGQVWGTDPLGVETNGGYCGVAGLELHVTKQVQRDMGVQ